MNEKKGENYMIDIILDTLIDGLKLIPFLFIAFLIIETIEHKLSKKSKKAISASGKFAPAVGSLLGLFPQCGFSVIATNLYITRIISLGTLIAIYLSTSDEMLPILLSQNTPLKTIILILGIKFTVGLISGYLIDLLFRSKIERNQVDYAICDEDHCGCNHKHGLIISSIIHTLKTLLYLLLITFIINILFTYVGSPILSKIFLKDSILAPFITSLIGFIPTCGSSIMLTELYLKEAISLGAAIAGLLTSSGVAILVLFKSNKNIKENLKILGILYSIGTIVGIIIQVII